MVEEQAGVEVVVEVHAQLEAALFHDVEAELLGDLLVLAAAGLLPAQAHADAFGGDARDVRQHGERFCAAAAYCFFVDARWGGVLLHVQPHFSGVCPSGGFFSSPITL